jgi:hypothetical protein
MEAQEETFGVDGRVQKTEVSLLPDAGLLHVSLL